MANFLANGVWAVLIFPLMGNYALRMFCLLYSVWSTLMFCSDWTIQILNIFMTFCVPGLVTSYAVLMNE